MAEQIKRHLSRTVAEDFKDIEAVFINGARQTGKSTFVEAFGAAYKNVYYFSFDDISLRAAEMAAPGSTFEAIEKGLVILDEIQLVPGSFLALKTKIDTLRRKKQRLKLLLTGSADIMLFPKLAEALVGRMYVRTLFPLSMAELTNTPGAFVEKNFKALSLSDRTFSKTAVSTAIPRATFPQLSLEIKNKSRWCQSYISTLLERDVKNLSEIDRIEILPPLLSLLANRTGGLVNDAALALAAKVSQPTLKRYRTLLNGVFLTWTLPPWLKNLEKRLVKSPKIYFHDTMLLCHILGFAPGELAAKRPELYGFILENFAAGELNKELSRLEGFRLYHFRTSDQKEIDFIIEGPRGDILAVEVKGSSSVFPEDFRHIRFLEAAVKERFIRGIVLYQGDKAIQFDRKLFALPFPALWEL